MLALAMHYSPIDFDEWDHVARSFGVDHVYCVGLGEDNETSVWEHIDSFDELPNDVMRIVLQPENGKYQSGDMSLADCNHPVDALYIFGNNDIHNPEVACDCALYIPMPSGSVTFYAAQAAFVVLYDRWTRGNN